MSYLSKELVSDLCTGVYVERLICSGNEETCSGMSYSVVLLLMSTLMYRFFLSIFVNCCSIWLIFIFDQL